jgi:argininosuccinate synthase
VLNKLGGRHGIGRVDMVENRFVGMKSRGVYETPGGSILHCAHRQMESLTMDREVMHLRDSLIPRYAEMVYYGFWYSPEREALQALIEESQRHVTGTVRLKLYKGNLIAAGRKSPVSLYQEKIATMEADAGAYQQADAGGFIRLNALRLKARAAAQGKPRIGRESKMEHG